MENTWKYKIDLRDKQMFGKIEEQMQLPFPEELKAFVQAHNAATPAHYNFMVGVSERVFGAVLSFNAVEEDADTVSTALKAVQTAELIPFAIDPFGNYICYNSTNSHVVFWDHETSKYQDTEKKFNEFLSTLY